MFKKRFLMFCKSIEHGTAFIVHLENWESYEYEESIHSFEEILYIVIKSEPLNVYVFCSSDLIAK